MRGELDGPDQYLPARPPLAALAFHGSDFAGQPVPIRPWHVRHMIPIRAVTLLQADGGMGKSTLALQLMAATVLGLPWLGQDVRKGRALYISCEDDRDEIHRRLDAITLDYGVQMDGLTGLRILDLTGEETVLAAADRHGVLLPTTRWQELDAMVEEWKPALVVIDNLADVFGGEENSRPHARQFISLLQGSAGRHNAAFVLIGHPSLQGISSGTGSSGSTAWNNSVRSRLYLTKPAEEDSRPGPSDFRVLSVKKANYAAAGLELRLRWQSGAFVLDQGGDTGLVGLDLRQAQAKAEAAFLRLLATFTSQGRRVSHTPSANYAPAMFAKDPAADGINRRGFEAAMHRLFAQGSIVVETTGPASRRRQQIVAAEAQQAEAA